MSASSQLFWKSPDPEASLGAALGKAGTRLQELTSQQWDPKTSTIGGVRDYQLSCLAPGPGTWSSLLLHLNSQLADPIAAELSTESGSPVIVFHEYDQSAWGFNVYENGHPVARFWNRPDVVEEDPREYAVSPTLVARLFGVGVEAVTPYLHHLDPEADDVGMAYPDDEFSLGDHWVRCDFMRRVGLRYPDPGEPGTRHVFVAEPGVN
jgi:hypothetical protein